MEIKHIKRSELVTTNWSGGTTTQLAIFPETSSYQEKNFLFRLSTAKVEAESSTFTKLPGVSRVIMILEGKLELTHQNQYSKTLRKFDTDTFEGDWDTTSLGQVTDFNLMTTNDAWGTLESMTLDANTEKQMTLFNIEDIVAFYAFQGSFSLRTQDKEELIQEGDIVLLFAEDNEEGISIITQKSCEVILTKIHQENN